jgi:hypothetical protein
MFKTNLRYYVCWCIVVISLFGGDAGAQTSLPDGELNLNFLFRLLLAGLIGVLIWIAKGTDGRLIKMERRIEEFNVISAERQATIEHNIARIMAIEHEQKQQASLISMQRELMLTKYLDKEETERHRARVEETLARQNDMLNTISHRLDFMSRPTHRAEDDRRHTDG